MARRVRKAPTTTPRRARPATRPAPPPAPRRPRGRGQIRVLGWIGSGERRECRVLARMMVGTKLDGSRHYRSKVCYGKTEAEAKRRAAVLIDQWKREKDEGIITAPSEEPLGAYVARWIRDRRARGLIRPRTAAEYEAILARLPAALQATPLRAVTPRSLNDLYTALAERLGPKSIRHVHSLLHAALRSAVEAGDLRTNPAAKATPPKVPRREMHALTFDEVKRLLAAAPERYRLLLAVAVATGMRPSEYLALQWRDVDLERGVIRVQRTVTEKAGQRYIGEPKTPRSRRSVPLPADLVAALRARAAAVPDRRPESFVFAGQTGQPIHERDLVRRGFKPALEAAGLPTTIRLYDLRHTHASLLLERGVSAKVISERLGHASITLTLDLYAHLLPGLQEAAAERLTGLWGPAPLAAPEAPAEAPA